MRFLADESCDFAVVRSLRRVGHDVLAVAETAAQSPDVDVLRLAGEEDRVILTEDKDFGRLVYAAGQRARGVVLIRFPAGTRSQVGSAVAAACAVSGESLRGSFVVVEPGRTRVDRLPAE